MKFIPFPEEAKKDGYYYPELGGTFIVETPADISQLPEHAKAFLPHQWRFLCSPKRYRALITGRGAGKTFGGLYAAWDMAGSRKCTGTVAVPTIPLLKKMILPAFLELFDPFINSFDKTNNICELKNGSVVYLISLVDPDKALRGINNSWFWMDEARECKTDYEWKILVATLREYPTGCRGIVTSTPCGKSHWLYEKFGLGGKKYGFFTAHTDENYFTGEEFKQDLKDEYDVGWFSRQELGGEFVDPAGDLFQPNWFLEAPPPEKFEYTIRGWDLATTVKSYSDYTVGVKLGICSGPPNLCDIWVLDVVRGKWEFPTARHVISETARADGTETLVVLEKTGMVPAVQTLLTDPDGLAGFNVHEAKRVKDKVSYALPIATRAKAGHFFLAENADWKQHYVDEFTIFDGNGKAHDDQVDATANAFERVGKARFRFEFL